MTNQFSGNPEPTQDSFDTGPLSWVIGEIRDSLARSKNAIFDGVAADDEGKSTLLAHAKSYLHQAHGALQIVDVDGVAIITETVEDLLERIKAGSLAFSQPNAEAIERSYQAVVEYLEELMAGSQPQPVRLFPYYRALLEVRGAERIHPADLFFPNLAIRPHLPANPAPKAKVDYTNLRMRFEKALLPFLKAGEKEKAAPLVDIISQVERNQENSQSQAFWWVMAGFAETVLEGQVPSEQFVKQLFGRINLQIRRLAEGSTSISERLLRDALFFIARASQPNPRAQQIRSVYQLGGLVPKDYERPRYGQIDMAALQMAKDHLNQAKTIWSRIADDDANMWPAFEQEMQILADASTKLNAPSLPKLLRELNGIARHAANGKLSRPMGLEIATNLLFVENTLEHITRLPDDFSARADALSARLLTLLGGEVPLDTAQWMDDLSRAAQQRQTVLALATEMKSNLRNVEKVLDEYFLDPNKRAGLDKIDGSLHQIAGALGLLEQNDAMLAVQHTQKAVRQFAQATTATDPASERQAMQDVAQNIGALGFFIEMLPQNFEGAKNRFSFNTETGLYRANPIERPAPGQNTIHVDVAPLPGAEVSEAPAVTTVEEAVLTVEEELLVHQQQSAELAASVAAHPEDMALQEQLKESLQQVRKDAALLDNPEAKGRAQAAIDMLESADFVATQENIVELMTPTEAPVAAPVAAPAPAPATDDAVDAELLEIFMMEADEVLAFVQENVPQSRKNPQNQDLLTTIRRSFHTLKGSGRMVGLNVFAEAAASIEQVMNLWLSDARSGTDDLYALLDYASEELFAWVKEIEAKGQSARTSVRIVAAAERLKNGGKFELDAEIPAPAPAPVPIPAPIPAPEPVPAPIPEPAPEPAPEPVVEQLVAAEPEPETAPELDALLEAQPEIVSAPAAVPEEAIEPVAEPEAVLEAAPEVVAETVPDLAQLQDELAQLQEMAHEDDVPSLVEQAAQTEAVDEQPSEPSEDVPAIADFSASAAALEEPFDAAADAPVEELIPELVKELDSELEAEFGSEPAPAEELSSAELPADDAASLAAALAELEQIAVAADDTAPAPAPEIAATPTEEELAAEFAALQAALDEPVDSLGSVEEQENDLQQQLQQLQEEAQQVAQAEAEVDVAPMAVSIEPEKLEEEQAATEIATEAIPELLASIDESLALPGSDLAVALAYLKGAAATAEVATDASTEAATDASTEAETAAEPAVDEAQDVQAEGSETSLPDLAALEQELAAISAASADLAADVVPELQALDDAETDANLASEVLEPALADAPEAELVAELPHDEHAHDEHSHAALSIATPAHDADSEALPDLASIELEMVHQREHHPGAEEFVAPSALPSVTEVAVALEEEIASDEHIKRIGKLEISMPLFNIYLAETDSIVRLLAQEFAEWRHEAQRPVLREAVHAVHSLAGSSATVGFKFLQELAHALEMALEHLRRHPVMLYDSEYDLLDQTVAQIKQMLQSFALGNMPERPDALIERLEAWQAEFAGREPLKVQAPETGYASMMEELEAQLLAEDVAPEQLAQLEHAAISDDSPLDEIMAGHHDMASAPQVAQTEQPELTATPIPEDLAVKAVTEVPYEDYYHAVVPESAELADGAASAELEDAELADSASLAAELLAEAPVEAPTEEAATEAPVEETPDAFAEVVTEAVTEVTTEIATEIATEFAAELPAVIAEPVQTAAPVAPVAPVLEAAPIIATPLAREETVVLETASLINDELDADLLPVFIEEGRDLLPQVGQALRSWQQNPADQQYAKSLLRLLHTVKGSARMAGAMRLGQHAHEIETRIENIMHLGPISQQSCEELLAHYDHSVHLFEVLQNPELAAQAAPVLPVAQEGGDDVAAALAATVQDITPAARVLPPLTKTVASQAPVPLVRVRADILDRLVNQAGEVSIARSKLENEVSLLRTSLSELTENIGRLRGQLREVEIQAESQITSRMAQQVDREFDPLEFDRFSRLQELTRMMAESVNDVASVQEGLQRTVENATTDLSAQARLTRDLQQDLMRVRMVPFSSVSERLFRVTRQAAKDVDKRVNLDIRGTSVEIDRGVLEKMAGPFEHLLRNAVAHGIESRAARREAGKSEIGELLVEIRQEGNEVVISFRDDGAGLNLPRIRAKAAEVGLLALDAEISDAEAMNLIFEPGFSTQAELTELAGRGVGMDVVRSEAAGLGGRVEIHSESGKGAQFTIHLPLTLAVTQVVLLSTGGNTYAVPSVLVEQVQQLKATPLEAAYKDGFVNWQGQHVPLHYLSSLLGDNRATPLGQRYTPVLILKSGYERVAVHVDEVIGNREVVVKNIGPQLARMPGIAGATVLGSGDIVLILNPVPLAQRFASQAERKLMETPEAATATVLPAEGELHVAASSEVPVAASVDAHDGDQLATVQDAPAVPAAPEAQSQTLRKMPIVMVVDDSLTVRKVTQRFLVREGYQVVLAKDGVDALEQLQTFTPDVMLVDIEMPRMDGFDLTRNVRNDERTVNTPIIMITSRTADKHRNYALELGVNAYFGKPFQEDKLLEAISGFVNKG